MISVGRSSKTSHSGFEHVNSISARIILQHPDRWGGEQSLMVKWARLFASEKKEEGPEAVAMQAGSKD